MKYFILPILIFSVSILSACSLGSNFSKNNTNNELQNDSQIGEEVATTTLDLSTQNLSKVPMEMFDRTDLKVLNLSYNKLTGALPAEIRKLSNLKTLKADHNMMTGVPAEVGQLYLLEELDLSYNKITGLPQEISNLKNLKTLNLKGNDYSKQDLEYIKSRLPNLTVIVD